MKRFSKLILAVAAIAMVVVMTDRVEARQRLLRRPLLRRSTACTTNQPAAAAPVRRAQCPGGTCRPLQFQEGAYTPLPAGLYDEPPLPTVVIEPADLAPSLSPRS